MRERENMDILGTNYTIINDNECLLQESRDGSCDIYAKIINVKSEDKMLIDTIDEDSKRKRHQEVMRHEIIHAFLFESGLDSYTENEELVDWIAIQFPKMIKAMKEVKSLPLEVSTQM